MFLHLVVVISCMKLLLIPCYTSTDFEVHRNWLAITHSLPLNEWYTEATSEWTLDYPPFFAWFEYALSKVAVFFDQEMLKVDNLKHKTFNTLLFQRISVIVTDLVLAIGIKICAEAVNTARPQKSEISKLLPLMIMTNAGLFVVDHIHFQYNGFLLGILLSSIGLMMCENYLISAFLFAVLLNLKHIYVYCAPAYFVYLLTSYCGQSGKLISLGAFKRLALLGSLVIAVFLISFGPFIQQNQFFVVLQRLFPFKRGLTHAYWAPNYWAVYNAMDRVAIVLAKRLGMTSFISAECQISQGASTSGLVKVSQTLMSVFRENSTHSVMFFHL